MVAESVRKKSLNSHKAAEYAPQIIAALERERQWLERQGPEEVERGFMAYYGKADGVDRRVRYCHFTVEVRNCQLWGVAECMVQGQLTPEELSTLMKIVSGAASDGFGENFEQHEINVGSGLKLYNAYGRAMVGTS